MAEQMTEMQVLAQEKQNTGTTWTHNSEFDKNGYFLIKDLWDPKELYNPVPEERGQLNYWGMCLDQYRYEPVEKQVEGSLARYWFPQYRDIHTGVRLKLEKIIGRKLYNTYYYRFVSYTQISLCESEALYYKKVECILLLRLLFFHYIH